MNDGAIEFERKNGLGTPIDYDKILNPDGVLPKTVLVEKPKPKMSRFLHFDIHTEDDVKIGNVLLYRSKPTKKRQGAYIKRMSIPRKENQNQGYGKSTYIEILKMLNGDQLSSGDLNKRSKRIWEWLVANGVARKISELWYGVYETIVPNS